jgi:hypothetical protein
LLIYSFYGKILSDFDQIASAFGRGCSFREATVLDPEKKDEYQRMLDLRSEMRGRLDRLPYHDEQTEGQRAGFEQSRDTLQEVTEKLIREGVMDDPNFLASEALELGLSIGWH